MTESRSVAVLSSKPYFPKHVRMQLDEVRDRVAVLAPERVYWPDGVAVDIIKLCDGELTIAEIAAALSAEYTAPLERIEPDVLEFVQTWLDLRLLRLKRT
jgi:pyrroloquinoline quinone biosynthesis protein D